MEIQPANLPKGIKLRHTLAAHSGAVISLAFDREGLMLASGGVDNTIRLWDVSNGRLIRTFDESTGLINSVVFNPERSMLASGGSGEQSIRLWNPADGRLLRVINDQTYQIAFDRRGQILAGSCYDNMVRLWDPFSGRLLDTLEGHTDAVGPISFAPKGKLLASGSIDSSVRLWTPSSGKPPRVLLGHSGTVYSVAFDPKGDILASGGSDNTIRLWDTTAGRLLRTLEGHTGPIKALAFSPDGTLLASKSDDGTVRLWRSDIWEQIAAIPNLGNPTWWLPALAFHPSETLLAIGGSDPTTPETDKGHLIHVWDLNLKALLGKSSKRSLLNNSVSYAVAKVLLVGDSGVGKSALANRLVKGEFVLTESTHGRHVHTFESVEDTGIYGERIHHETVLWDLAGQPGYRLIHQLQMEDAAVALVLFDSRSETDPFSGAAFWSEALDQAASNAPIAKILVASRVDRAGVGVSEDAIQRFVKDHGFVGFVRTSAKTGEGIERLAAAIRRNIHWDELPLVTSTKLMQKVRTFIEHRKMIPGNGVLQTTESLREAFRTEAIEPFSEDDFSACLSRLEQTDVIDVLRPYVPGEHRASSSGSRFESDYLSDKNDIVRRRRDVEDQDEILLQPSYVDAYASAIIIAAKDDPRGIGHLLEEDVFRGRFPLNSEERIPNSDEERKLLVHVVEELLRRELALRESLEDGDYLVFPSQYTRDSPFPGTNAFGVSYDFRGPVRNVFTTLVVRLAHHSEFIERDFFRDAAAYESRSGGKCIVVLHDTGPGIGRLSVYFEGKPKPLIPAVFLRYVYEHLKRRAIPGSVTRQRVYHCRKCSYKMDPKVVEDRLRLGKQDVVCPKCDERQPLYDLLVREEEKTRGAWHKIDEDARQAKSREVAIARVEGMRERAAHDFLLSYSSGDRTTVLRLAESLKAVGLRPWIDVWDLIPGRPWQEALEKAIDRIPCAAICIGPSGMGPWQDREVRAYLNEFVRSGKRLIPVILPHVKIDPEFPMFLRAFPCVDLRDKDVSQGSGLRFLVAGILDVAPIDVADGALDAMLVAQLRERERRRKNVGKPKRGALTVPLDQDFEKFDELSKIAVAAQIAELLDIPSDEVRTVGLSSGSVKIHMEFDDADGACRFFAQIQHGHPDAIKQFERWRGLKEEFVKDNPECAMESKTHLKVGNINVAEGGTVVIGDGSGGVAGGMPNGAMAVGSPNTTQSIAVTKEEAASALCKLSDLLGEHLTNPEDLGNARKSVGGAQSELDEDEPDLQKVAKRTAQVTEALRKTGAGAKWFNDVVKCADTVASYCGQYGSLIIQTLSGVGPG